MEEFDKDWIFDFEGSYNDTAMEEVNSSKENSSILTTVKTSGKADISKIIVEMDEFDKVFNKLRDFDPQGSYNDKAMEEDNSSEEDSSIWTTVKTSIKNLNATYYRRSPYAAAKIGDVVKYNVLPYLLAKSITRFSSVSKGWDQWIKSPLLAFHQSYSFRNLSGYFVQHKVLRPTLVTLNHDSYGVPSPSLGFLPDFVNLLSSSNGLLLCQSSDSYKDSVYICNPATKEWRELSCSNVYLGMEPATVIAFEPSVINMSANYQLICAAPSFYEPVVSFELYSSETNRWTQSNTICLELGYAKFTGNGFYMKGMAFWQTTDQQVLAFDMNNESYEIISLPPNAPEGGVLCQMHEELCYIGMSYENNAYWLKIYSGMDLELKVSIYLPLQFEPVVHRVLPCADNGFVMFLVGSSIYSYSLVDGIAECRSNEGIITSNATYLPYVNSLVRVA